MRADHGSGMMASKTGFRRRGMLPRRELAQATTLLSSSPRSAALLKSIPPHLSETAIPPDSVSQVPEFLPPAPIQKRCGRRTRAIRAARPQSMLPPMARTRRARVDGIDRRAASARPVPPRAPASPFGLPTSEPGSSGHKPGSGPERDAGPCRRGRRKIVRGR
jgi:hypothetical protein